MLPECSTTLKRLESPSVSPLRTGLSLVVVDRAQAEPPPPPSGLCWRLHRLRSLEEAEPSSLEVEPEDAPMRAMKEFRHLTPPPGSPRTRRDPALELWRPVLGRTARPLNATVDFIQRRRDLPRPRRRQGRRGGRRRAGRPRLGVKPQPSAREGVGLKPDTDAGSVGLSGPGGHAHRGHAHSLEEETQI